MEVDVVVAVIQNRGGVFFSIFEKAFCTDHSRRSPLLQQWIDQMQASRLPAFDPSAAVNFAVGGNIFGMPNQVMIFCRTCTNFYNCIMHNLQISHYTHDTCSSLSLLSFIQLHTTT